MDEVIEYRPYKVYTYFIPLVLFCAIFAFIVVGYSLAAGLIPLLMLTVGILSIWLTKVLYNASNIVILADQHSLQIVSKNDNQYQHIPWENLSYAYYTKSFKGHLFLVLSSQTLSSKNVKKLVNSGANSYRICIDGTIVLPITFLKNASQLSEMIVAQKLHINGHN